MTVKSLECLLHPRSVALIGADTVADTVAGVTTHNLISSGFTGDLFLVNSRQNGIEGHKVYASPNRLPKTPDLAVIVTPSETVPGIVEELGSIGNRAIVVLTSGLGEEGSPEGQALNDAMLTAAMKYGIRILGPHCFGIMVPRLFLNASFVHVQPLPGKLAFVTQSGAILSSVLDWATQRRIGFSHLVSMGNMVDVDFGDMLDFLANDFHTRAILIQMESVTNARKFMSAARAAARIKPVIVVKAGRGIKAMPPFGEFSKNNDAVYDAAFRRAGILRVRDLKALFDSVATLSLIQPVDNNRLAIITNGRGLGLMATDALMEKNGRLAPLSSEIMVKLDSILPRHWSHGNPVDIIGDASPGRYAEALEILFDSRDVDAVLVINGPSAVASSIETANRVIQTVEAQRKKSGKYGILTCWIGEGPARVARQLFLEKGIPSYETPMEGVRGFMQMVRYRMSQEMLMETPPDIPEDFTPDITTVRRLIATALGEGRFRLTEVESKNILKAYAIPVVETLYVNTPKEAETMAQKFKGPVLLKTVLSEMSDDTQLTLRGETPEMVAQNAEALKNKSEKQFPESTVSGFTVQPVINYPNARHLLLGMFEDQSFGPVITFGHGGVAASIVEDTAFALPPLNMKLAVELMSRTRIFRLMEGFKGRKAVDIEEVAFTLVKLSQLVCDISDVSQIEINPLIVTPEKVLALNARIRLVPCPLPSSERLSIRPYPKELEKVFYLSGGKKIVLRPIRPEDEPEFHALFGRLTPEEILFRFLHPMKSLSHTLAARMTQIDYDREMSMVLSGKNSEGRAEIYGAVQITAHPDQDKGEFAILLRNDMTGMGLGPMLMRRIIEYCKNRGLKEIFGEVLVNNRNMLALCRAFGFTRRRDPDDSGIYLVSLNL